MTNYPYLLFNQTPAQLRRIGTRGGKAQARNRRARSQAQAQLQPQTLAVVHPPAETAAQASSVLDAQFPWLRGAGKRWAPGARNPMTIPDQSPFPPSRVSAAASSGHCALLLENFRHRKAL
jgi:hypothetical protein